MATDNHTRRVVNTLSWRITGTVDTILNSWLITREFKFALSIYFVEPFTKIIRYYGHSRLWNRIFFGRVKTGEDYAF